MRVPFNKPYFIPDSVSAFSDPSILRNQGGFYQACEQLILQLGFKHAFLTPSCTDALELVAISLGIQPGDEIILPSYTYVSTANAFVLRGAVPVFVDCRSNHPTLDFEEVEKAITSKTKAIIIMHYGGMAPDYSKWVELKSKWGIPLIEDAAHCYAAKSEGIRIGSVGDFATFSFHETKNITCGQGGAVVVNNPNYLDIVRQVTLCGTDKFDFIDQKVSSYSWKSLGSNFILAEPLCGLLLAGLQSADKINHRRNELCARYFDQLKGLQHDGKFFLPPYDPEGNGHIFYLVTHNIEARSRLVSFLRSKDIEALFHYTPLHLSDYYLKTGKKLNLPNTCRFGDCLVRLPLFFELSIEEQDLVIESILEFKDWS